MVEFGRFKEAIPFLKKAVLEDADNLDSKYFLALCYLNIEDTKRASSLADSLLQEVPNNADVFFLKARIAFRNDFNDEALDFVQQAISLDPYNADYFGFESGILLNEKEYGKALKTVNEGLEIDPKNAYCLNIRVQILTKLERFEEANETVENILHDNPEDSYSHANVGWVALENGDTKKALEHFKQALQFDPNFDYAREGMSTALKSKNLIYKWYLKYSFWISKKSSKNQWVFIIGLYLVYRFAFNILEAGGFTYLAVPLMIAYLFFALGSWIMEPFSNAILNFDSYGKYLLSGKEKISGYVFGGLFLMALISVGIFYATNLEYPLVLGVTFISMILPLPRSILSEKAKTRNIGLAYSSVMLLVGTIGPLFMTNFNAGLTVFIMLVAYTWLGNLIEQN